MIRSPGGGAGSICGFLGSTVVDQVKQVLRGVPRSRLATPPPCGFGGGPDLGTTAL